MTDLLVSGVGVVPAFERNMGGVEGRAAGICLAVTSDLASLEAEWRSFEQDANSTPFQSFDWLSAWDDIVGRAEGICPAIVTGRKPDGTLLFILPLAIKRSLFVRTLTFLGHALCDYNAPLLASDFYEYVGGDVAGWFERCRDMLQNMPKYQHDLVMLEKMPERIGSRRNPMASCFSMLHPSGAHSTRLAADWDSFYASKTSGDNRRRDRARRRQLEERGEIHFTTARGAEESDAALDILFDYKGSSLERMGARNIFAPAAHRDFFRTVASSPNVHVSRLDVGDHCAAVNLGMMAHGCYFHILTTFDDNLRRFGPGAMHLRELMRYGIEHGCTTFDFTVGDESFKRDWSDTELILYDHVSAVSLVGHIAALHATLWRRLKRHIKQSSLLWPFAIKVRQLLGQLRGDGSAVTAPSARAEGDP